MSLTSMYNRLIKLESRVTLKTKTVYCWHEADGQTYIGNGVSRRCIPESELEKLSHDHEIVRLTWAG